MAESVLLIEQNDPCLRLMEWGLTQEGFDVYVLRGEIAPPTDVLRLQPDFIVLNTTAAEAGKRAIISALRYLVPKASIIDLLVGDVVEAYDSGADAYVGPPHQLADLRSTMAAISGRKLEATARRD